MGGRINDFGDKKKEPNHKVSSNFLLAGVAGFEPAVHATKKRCLTSWLHPTNPFSYLLFLWLARELL